MKNRAPELQYLTLLDRLSYGLGGAVYAVKEAAYIMFVLLFYTQVMGLSGTATGIVLSISLLWDAVSDPMVGSWSDRFKSRWGRRHPFMIYSSLPLGLGFIALFAPPEFVLGNELWLAGWLLLCSIWIRTALTFFSIPHYTLVAEITQDYHDRSALMGQRTAFLFLTTLLLPSGSLYFLFGEGTGGDGRFVAENYVIYGCLSALIIWITATGCIAGTWKFIGHTRIDPERAPSTPGFLGLWRDFLSTFRNRNFRNLLCYDLAATASYGITVALNIIFWTYFWELDANETGLVLGLSVVIAVPIAMVFLKTIGRRMHKHDIIKWAVGIMLLDLTWPYLLRFLDLIPDNDHPVILAILVTQNAVFMSFFILRIVAITSLTADLTDEHEAETGLRQEGGFYSVLQFTTKLGGAVGPLYGGFALDVVGLKEGMRPGLVEQPMLDALVLIGAAAIIPLMLIAFFFAFRFSMTEERLLQIQGLIARLRRHE
ncbi:MFS transporter [Parasphingorhabdus sp.]|uniref:MFS transporter n=1 Tax=Parasphingorhabdus sp. TaxID=2709688 RepID=UPI003263FB12